MKSKKWILLGAGGHARVLLQAMDAEQINSLCAISAPHSDALKALLLNELPLLTSDSEILHNFPPGEVQLVNGLGAIGDNSKRRKLFTKFKQAGYDFLSVIHSTAIIAHDVSREEGCQIMAGAIIQTGTTLGKNCLVNTGAIIDHECQVDDHTHIAPGVVLSGGVCVGENSHIGTGASVIQGILIGRNVLVAAGSVVIRNLPDDSRVAGVPALPI